MSWFRKSDGYSRLPTDEVTKPIFDYSSPFVYEDSHKHYRSIFTYQPTFNPQPHETSDENENFIQKTCTGILIVLTFIAVLFTAPISLYFALKVIPKHERILVFRLGRLQPLKGPGTVCVLPLVDRYQRLDMRMKAFIIPPQQFITADGAVVEMGAEMRFRITDGPRTALHVQDLDSSVRILGRSILVNHLCKKSVSQLERERADISLELRDNMNQSVGNWGLEISETELSFLNVLRATEPRTAINQLVSTVQNMLGVPTQAKPEPNKVPSPPNYFNVRLNEVMKTAEESGQLPHIRAVFQLELSGPQGGIFTISIDNGRCLVTDGPSQPPDVVITISADDFEQIFSSEITPLQAYISGRLKVSGDVQLLMTLEGALQSIKSNKKSTILTV